MVDQTTRLQAERKEILAKLKCLRRYLETEVERVIDSVDAASDIYERGKTLAIIETLQEKLASIENALRAAEKGHYGICDMCGGKIDPARLEIVPYATTCVKCQEKLERSLRSRPTLLFPRKKGRNGLGQ